MHRRPFLALAACASTAVVLAAVLAAAPAAAGERPPKPDGTLVLAHLGPETGEVAPIIESLRAPVRLAVDEINAAGGVLGRKFEVTTPSTVTVAPGIGVAAPLPWTSWMKVIEVTETATAHVAVCGEPSLFAHWMVVL